MDIRIRRIGRDRGQVGLECPLILQPLDLAEVRNSRLNCHCYAGVSFITDQLGWHC